MSLARPSDKQVVSIKIFVFVLAVIPAALLAYRLFLYSSGAMPEALGINPAETLSRGTGDWTLRMFLITLAVTPLRRITGWVWLIRLRRTLGLYAFFYGCLHLLVYLVIDQMFDWMGVLKDIAMRPYITVGMAAILLAVPLAVTSTNAMVRRLGGHRWRVLHRLVYVIAPLGVLHYFWLVKADHTEPIIYAVILFILFIFRLRWPLMKNSPQSSRGKLQNN